MTEDRYDSWAAGEAYERYMGRWSRPLAGRFVAWLDPGDGGRWLDAGCGTGALTAALAAPPAPGAGPREVVGLERSPAYAAFAASAHGAPGAPCVVGDAQALPFADGACDGVVSGLVLNFLPEPGRAVAEAVRVVRAGGTVAAYVWDYAGGMELLRYFWEAATAVDASALPLDEGRRFPLCRPEPLRALWEEAGLADVEVAALGVGTVFGGFADLWEPFLAGQGPAPGYVASLASPGRDRLRERLRASLPVAQDGSIALRARAWAVRGRRPPAAPPPPDGAAGV
ncbi:methyltransferase [Streptomyces sp. CB00455]|uniref:class I SAM-dependent methyltransferase n=1 Tax=Streptomyces sp. CB00455 TaxID=1703927 RepID=UPI00093AC977|nr:class I SAM-dependent methyltransferase [Streptomyces sp. CB00455]OKK22247.1 methyltransferase [Streptomyces sp. CB00455]